jgi:hypothetical protein
MDKIPTFAAMLQSRMANTNILVFSKWSRKSYAIFASLHKVVVIAQLSVDLCRASLLKNQVAISLLNWSNNGEEEKADDIVPDDLSENQQNLLLLLAIATSYKIVSEHRIIIKSNNEKPIFCTMQNMGFSLKKNEYD